MLRGACLRLKAGATAILRHREEDNVEPKKVMSVKEMVKIFQGWAGQLLGEPFSDSVYILQIRGEHYACKYWLWSCGCEVREYSADVLGAFPCDIHRDEFHAKVHWP